MTPDKYRERIDSCKNKQELQTLLHNTQEKGRHDLAKIAEEELALRFPSSSSWKPSTARNRAAIPYEKAKENYKNHPLLKRDQVEFLAKHGVPEQSLFDASGMMRTDYKKKMGEQNRDIAYGTTPCATGGHTLRTSAGHCIQCDPAKLSYLQRHRAPGEVYIAESRTGSPIIKVGSGENPANRVNGLNSDQYAGRRDWVIRYQRGVKCMGLVESKVHAALSQYAITELVYLKDGKHTSCREVFSCSVEDAISKLLAIIENHP